MHSFIQFAFSSRVALSKTNSWPKFTLLCSFKVFRIQWSAMKSSTSSKTEPIKVERMSQSLFEECNNWGEIESEDNSWMSGPPSNKKSSDANGEKQKNLETSDERGIESLEKESAFKKRFQPYFLTFDAEDLTELSKLVLAVCLEFS